LYGIKKKKQLHRNNASTAPPVAKYAAANGYAVFIHDIGRDE
jgi:hypothetical protein